MTDLVKTCPSALRKFADKFQALNFAAAKKPLPHEPDL